MDTKVVLCADSESLHDPRLVGLEGENLDAQAWLRVFCSAVEARNYLKNNTSAEEVWVASSDEVDSINLAAALKKDSWSKGVYLLAFQGTGSLKSRASAAGVNGTLSQQDFLKRYSERKETGASVTEAVSEEAVGMFADIQYDPPLPEKVQVESVERIGAPQILRTIRSHSAHVLSVVSASGGSGKSTIAALTALFAQGLGYRTLLLDADLQFGDMAYFLGEKDPLTIDALVEDLSLISQLNPQGLRPALLAAPKRLEQFETIGQSVPRILDALKPHFDVIVANTGGFWTEQHVSLLEQSSTGLFVLGQHSASIQSCKHALELCDRCGIATHPFLFALNRCSRNAALTSIDASCALQGAHVVELQEGGREVGDLLSAGMPFELIESRNSLCLSIERMLIDLLPKKNQVDQEIPAPKKEGKRFRLNRKRRRVACL